MKVVHQKTGKILANDLKHASTMLERMLGLMFVKEMKGMDGLLLDPCNSIHNFFVRFPIDVIFLNKNYEVVKMIKPFRPWRITGIYFKAKMVLELPENTIPDEVKVGDKLEVVYV